MQAILLFKEKKNIDNNFEELSPLCPCWQKGTPYILNNVLFSESVLCTTQILEVKDQMMRMMKRRKARWKRTMRR